MNSHFHRQAIMELTKAFEGDIVDHGSQHMILQVNGMAQPDEHARLPCITGTRGSNGMSPFANANSGGQRAQNRLGTPSAAISVLHAMVPALDVLASV